VATSGTGVVSTTNLVNNNIVIIPPSGSTGNSGGENPPPPPPPPPPPSEVTYTYQAIANGWFTTTVDPNSGGTSATLSAAGWGIRTGLPDTYSSYYTYSSSGTNTTSASTPFQANAVGTNQSIISGVVTGIPGQTLTGPVTITSIDSYGNTLVTTAIATIDPSGQVTYTYTGTLNAPWRTTAIQRNVTATSGTYFTQTLEGAGLTTSAAPYSTQSGSTLWAGGSRTMNGVTSYYSADISGTATSFPPAQSNYYLPLTYNGFSSTMQGVVNPTSGAGAMTLYGDQDYTGVLPLAYLFPLTYVNSPTVGSITIQPSGSASGTIYNTYFDYGKFFTEVYNATLTPVASPVTPVSVAYDFSQTYNGSMWLNQPSGTSTDLQVQGMAWGQRTGTITPLPGSSLPANFANALDQYFVLNDNGTWTGASGSVPFPYSSTVAVTQMSGRVTGVLGQNLTGNMTFIGSLLNGVSFHYEGPVNIDSDGHLNFSYGNTAPYTSYWKAAGVSGPSGPASGQLGEFPGYHTTGTATYALTPGGVLTISGGTFGGATGATASFTSDSFPATEGTITGSVATEGVVGTWAGGNQFGAATFTLSSPLSMSIPGFVNINSGTTYFNMGGLFTQLNGSPVNVSQVPQTVLWTFYETYFGFRLSTSSSPYNLAGIEGYAWGQRLGTTTGFTVPPGYTFTVPAGFTAQGSALPASYCGYFIAQDLGSRAALVNGTLGSSWVTVTGTLAGNLSGPSGGTLTGQAIFTGTTSTGVQFTYSGPVSLSSDGKLTFSYGGTWTALNGSGTGGGSISQIPGTYFTETASGNLQATSTPYPVGSSGATLNVATVTDTAGLNGQRIMAPGTSGQTTTSTTGSFAAGAASQTNTYPSGSTGATLTLQGVVASTTGGTSYGVATGSSPEVSAALGSAATISGPVSIDAAGKLTGQFVDSGGSNKIGINMVSVPAGSGQSTSSFTQTVTGNFSQTADPTGTMSTLTAPSVTGTATGTLSGATTGSLTLNSQTTTTGTLGTNSGTVTASVVGVVGGPTGGLQTGVASVQLIRNVTAGSGTGTYLPRYLGGAALQPASGTAPAVLTTNLSSILNNSPINGASLNQTGVLTTRRTP
jgi:hypothetical protein